MEFNNCLQAAQRRTELPAPRAGEKIPSEYHDQQHFELLLTVDGVGMARGHDDGLALVQLVVFSIDRDSAHAI